MSTPWLPFIRREELVDLLTLCGTLAGLCIGVIALISTSGRVPVTLIDDALAICAASFVSCIYLVVWAIRTPDPKRALVLTRAVEVQFLSTLTVMTVAAFAVVYRLW